MPSKKGSELYFQGDTLVMVDLEGYNPADQYFYSQKSDTLFLSMIGESSISCRDEVTASYKLSWANNGEKLLLKPIKDPCIIRFTLLVSENPWFRKREKNEVQNDWHFLDPIKDKIPGISLYEAYKILKFRKSKPIIVAVLDCPIDYTHEDLKEKMWVNSKEIPQNKIDDDKNGFKDDSLGWFFVCSKSGKPIQKEQPVETQVYSLWKSKFDTVDGRKLKGNALKEFKVFQMAKSRFLEKFEVTQNLKLAFSDSLLFLKTLIGFQELLSEPITVEKIKALPRGNSDFEKAILSILPDLYAIDISNYSRFLQWTKKNFTFLKTYYSEKWLYSYNLEWQARTQIGDYPQIPKEKMYGSHYLSDPKNMENDHGTHVAGIIGAKRGNGKGIEGIADNIQIMTLGVVPFSGDERDKDVANAIRYAADNGAKIINMSFAKWLSPHKIIVDEAIQYAEKKGILFINASGNGSENTDSIKNYPIVTYENGKTCLSWIEVGNSTPFMDEGLVAPTSNYGKKTIDIFAPGTDIFSCMPDNTYDLSTGTSMSAPVVTGVAALIWSYFPKLTANQLKTVLMESAFIPPVVQVNKPGTTKLVAFKSLSKTGGIVNAKQAIFAAEKMLKKKKA